MNDYNRVIHELNAIKRALGISSFTDDISLYGRMSRVEDASIQNLQVLNNKTYIMDGISTILEVTSSDNPIFINGSILTKTFDYSIVDGTNIQFNEVLEEGTEIIELVGSFVQQNKLEFFYTTLDGATSIIEVSDTNNPIFIDGVLLHPSNYNIISTYQIEFLVTYPNTTLVGELLGGGRNGTDGYIPVKGLDYVDGIDGPKYLGNYIPELTYNKDNLVKYQDQVWICLVDNSFENIPGISSHWEIFVKSGTMKYLEGIDFPPADISSLGSFFHKDDGGLYICVNSAAPYWQQIGA